MRITRYLETGSQNPFYNLAFEEYVLRVRTEGNYLMLWQNDNTIVIGRNQNAEAEINRGFVEAHHINVVRRTTGGGAVYHDLGNLNYSFITDADDAEQLTFEKFSRPMVGALQDLGLNAEVSGRNDILVDGRKVSGTAQRVLNGRILHHGCLLFDSDSSMVSGALNVDPSKFQSKGTKSVRSRVGNIRNFLKKIDNDMELVEFWSYLKSSLAKSIQEDVLTEEELIAIADLKRTKYDAWEWNFGRSPKFDYVNKCRFDGGSLEVGLSVKSGIIMRSAFYGDFMAVASLEPLREALVGCPFRLEDVSTTLDRFPLKEMFGGITRDEVLSVLFSVRDRPKSGG